MEVVEVALPVLIAEFGADDEELFEFCPELSFVGGVRSFVVALSVAVLFPVLAFD